MKDLSLLLVRLQIYLMLYKLVQKVGKYQCYVGRRLLNIAETGYY